MKCRKSVIISIIILCFCHGQLVQSTGFSGLVTGGLKTLLVPYKLSLADSRINNFKSWNQQGNVPPEDQLPQRSTLGAMSKSVTDILLHPEITSLISACLCSHPSTGARLAGLTIGYIPSLIVAAKLSKAAVIHACHPVRSYNDAKNCMGEWYNQWRQKDIRQKLIFTGKMLATLAAFRVDYKMSAGLLAQHWARALYIASIDLSSNSHEWPTLSSYNPEYAAMAQQVGLDPTTIRVGCFNDLAACGGGFISQLLLLDEGDFAQLAPSCQRAIIGHELLHLKERISLKVLFMSGLADLVIRGGLKGSDWLVQKAKEKCNRERHPHVYRVIEGLHKIAHAASSMPVVEPCIRALCLKAFVKYYKRGFEISADINSARQFGTANGLIGFCMQCQKQEAGWENMSVTVLKHGSMQEKMNALMYLWDDVWDEHPSWEERIRYLSPIALQQQEQLAQ